MGQCQKQTLNPDITHLSSLNKYGSLFFCFAQATAAAECRIQLLAICLAEWNWTCEPCSTMIFFFGLNHGIGGKKTNYQTRGEEQKGGRHLLFLRPGREYARFRGRNFRWRSFRWWNFRWRGVRWSVRKKCWVFAGPIRLLNFFEECCWCQTDLRDHFLCKHLHRFRLASELWVCLLVLHVQF